MLTRVGAERQLLILLQVVVAIYVYVPFCLSHVGILCVVILRRALILLLYLFCVLVCVVMC